MKSDPDRFGGDARRRPQQVRQLVEHLFRRQYGRMVARLVRILGPPQLSLAEEVVQEALMAALQTWPFRGVPDQPEAWLVRVARNRALDVLRRRENFRRKEQEVRLQLEDFALLGSHDSRRIESESWDEQLQMMFLCCRPELPAESSVALILKTVCGFGVSEIARAFLSRPDAVAQRLVRAKRRLREAKVRFEMPPSTQLEERLDLVLAALYLMFHEGYWPHQGAEVVREEMLREALRLGQGLAANPQTSSPRVCALVALMCFLAARVPARLQISGELQLLADQDRQLWDRALTAQGFSYFERSMRGEQESPYHLQAAIAALHASAPDYASTDWPAICRLYDRLLEVQPSAIVRLNRCVAVSFLQGPRAGLRCLESLSDEPSLRRYHLLPAVRGALCLQLGEWERAAGCYREALACACSETERRFLEGKLAECQGRGGA